MLAVRGLPKGGVEALFWAGRSAMDRDEALRTGQMPKFDTSAFKDQRSIVDKKAVFRVTPTLSFRGTNACHVRSPVASRQSPVARDHR